MDNSTHGKVFVGVYGMIVFVLIGVAIMSYFESKKSDAQQWHRICDEWNETTFKDVPTIMMIDNNVASVTYHSKVQRECVVAHYERDIGDLK